MEQTYTEQNGAPMESQPACPPQPEAPAYTCPPQQPPVYTYPPQQAPGYTYPPQQPPVYPYPTYAPRPEDIPGLPNLVESAFNKGLTAVILSQFPIASIISIFMGNKANKLVEQAEALAAQYGTRPSGKNTAAKVLGKVGFFVGIYTTIQLAIICSVYFLYFFLIFIIMLSSQAMYY